jgi:hypothetical protein
MKDLAENNLIRFKNISKKKETMVANFKVKGLRNGVNFTASISVDLSAAELHPGDVLEKLSKTVPVLESMSSKRLSFNSKEWQPFNFIWV